jgi:hypothetical protein
MRTWALLFLLLVTAAVDAADSFSARAQRAKAIEESAEGQSFQKVLWGQAGDHSAKAMQHCFPKGVTADTNSFTLVANLIPGRTLANVEVRPRTKMAQCFADGFSKAPFPEPPQGFGSEGLPLVIEMKIKP